MRRPIWLALGGFLVLLCGFLVSGGPAQGASSQPRYLTFVDDAHATIFRMQVEPGAPGFGTFVLRTPGGVLYRGSASGAISLPNPSLIVIAYAGSAQRYPAGNPANPATAGNPTTVQVVLEAQLKPGQHTAQGQLLDGLQIFPFLALGAAGAPPLSPVLDTFDNATRQGNWATLYTLMNEKIRQTNTAAGFGAAMAQGNAASGPIVALRRGAVGGAQTNDDGITLAVVAYALDRQTDAGVVTKQYDATFVLEQGAWKLRYMDEH